MKKQHRRMTLVIATLVISVFIMASNSFASPTLNANCALQAGCHTTLGTTLSVNATGTIQSTRGVSFLLIIDAGGDAGAISMQSADADNGEFTVSDDIVEDGDAEDTNANEGEIQASITFTPQAVGSFTIRIWSAATGGVGRSVNVDVNVAESTITTGTTSTTPTTTTPPTTPTTLTPEELIAIWELMMYTITPAAAVILGILGLFVLRRART